MPVSGAYMHNNRVVFGSDLRRMNNGREAFTLIELLVVVAIIAVLAGLLIPAVGLVRGHAMQANCLSNLRQLSMGVLVYASDNDSCVPPGQVGAPDRDTLQLPYWGMWFGFIGQYLPAGENTLLYWDPAGSFTRAEMRAMGNNAYYSSYNYNTVPFDPLESGVVPWYGLALSKVRRSDMTILLADVWGADGIGSSVAYTNYSGGLCPPKWGPDTIISGPRRPTGNDNMCAFPRASHANNSSTDAAKGRIGTAFFSGRVEALRWQDSFVQGGFHDWNFGVPNQWRGRY